MTKKIIHTALIFAGAMAFVACHKTDHTPTNSSASSQPVSSAQVIDDFTTQVALQNYTDLYNQAVSFQTTTAAFYANPNDNDLANLRTLWKSARVAWEQSESFLFGPIETDNMDPDIDTWPVNKQDLDSLLNTSVTFTSGYMDSLQQSLKGFHPIEYMIFGTSGNKTAAQFTAREKDYLMALANHIKSIITKMKDSYTASLPGNFATVLTTSGPGNTTYGSHKAVLVEIANAMSGICDEVANGKIDEVLIAQDPTLEESYFSKNSWTDFKNNITGVKNVYLGVYGSSSGKSLSDLVSQKNLSLHNTLLQKMNAAISAFNNVTVPFGQAISQQQVQVQNTINAVNDLKNELDNNLVPFLNQYITD